MPAAKRTPARKASGENRRNRHPGPATEDWQRHTVPILLRLPPEIATTLRARAAREEMTIAAYVARLVTQDAMVV